MKRYPKGTWMKLRSAEILVAFMRQKEFSMERLARYAGCSKSMISHLTSGRKSSCSPALAERIAEALDIPTEALFDLRASAISGHNDRRERVA
ncbi:MAG: helix-turn-helix transcriptional regulator [Nocardioidaceae bacterium]|nr:helix-turn-helix transcriptional regulator [Nocardioidaceae bacterium]